MRLQRGRSVLNLVVNDLDERVGSSSAEVDKFELRTFDVMSMHDVPLCFLFSGGVFS